MKIVNAFDAVRDGTYQDFIKFYDGNPNLISKNLRLNLLDLAVVNDYNPEDKIRIMKFLIKEGADVNFTEVKNKRNALHIFYFNVLRPNPEYMLQVTKLFVENGININCKDKYGAIPLKYAITVVQLPTKEIKDVYEYLMAQGSDLNSKDAFDKSCVDYIKEYSWRSEVMDIVKEIDRENK